MPVIQSLLSENLPTPVQQIHESSFAEHGIQLFLKRDDLIHPEISGNKWRKLKYNLMEAQRQGCNTVLTFGGAFSNHIAATAAACRLAGFKSIGIIRGEELQEKNNATLRQASKDGMHLEFISRENYRRKNAMDFLEALREKFGAFYMIPEGGANEMGVAGCAEIIQEANEHFDTICVACGTGTTMAGILAAAKPEQQVLGFPALKGGYFLTNDVLQLLSRANKTASASYELILKYHFGGYAQHSSELLHFIRNFKAKHSIELDFIYTGKMLFGIYDLIQKRFFRQATKILAIHTGGLQGNSSIAERLKDVSQIP